MRMFLKATVWDVALDRIRRIFDEFRISGRLRAALRVSSFASFGIAGSGPHGVSVPVHFRSLSRVTACVVVRVARRRRIGPSPGECSGAFLVASARHTACVVVRAVRRRRIGPSRGEFFGPFSGRVHRAGGGFMPDDAELANDVNSVE